MLAASYDRSSPLTSQPSSSADGGSAVLGVDIFIERHQISIGIEDGELLRSPRFAYQRGIRMNYGLTRALSMQLFDHLDFYPASCCFRNAPIFAGPEVNFYCAVGNNAVLTLGHMHFAETQLGNEEFGTSLYIEGRKNGSCGNELDSHADTGVLTPNS